MIVVPLAGRPVVGAAVLKPCSYHAPPVLAVPPSMLTVVTPEAFVGAPASTTMSWLYPLIVIGTTGTPDARLAADRKIPANANLSRFCILRLLKPTIMRRVETET